MGQKSSGAYSGFDTQDLQSPERYTTAGAEDESRMMRLLSRIVADESGQDMIEYALIAALLGLSVATVLRNFSNDIKGDFTGIGNQLTNAVL